jgi:hypothetical protein
MGERAQDGGPLRRAGCEGEAFEIVAANGGGAVLMPWECSPRVC